MMNIALVAGARPNFMKVAPIVRALRCRKHRDWFLVHTGQHYDPSLSDVFFDELQLPKPDVWLGVGSGSHAEQTARVMTGFETVCRERTPDLVLVVGDVNSTMAATIVAAKLCIPVAHIEAGLRSRDRTMPEEVNRLVTDVLADYLFTTSEDADENLRDEGIPSHKIHFVGNVMVDSLLQHLECARRRDTLARLGLQADDGGIRPYAVLTLHRPSNVDHPETFGRLMQAVEHVARRVPVIFPVHPRTAGRVRGHTCAGDLRLVEPQGYLDFLALLAGARLVLTDSGGLQEETTVLGVPCLTMRENTERPVTVTLGTNVMVGTDPACIIEEADRALDGARDTRASSPRRIPPLWDGHAAERIVNVLLGAS
jgi:UDP-N-acetylglucosamine 2-epimerase (non-hydrolysing)